MKQIHRNLNYINNLRWIRWLSVVGGGGGFGVCIGGYEPYLYGSTRWEDYIIICFDALQVSFLT